jgi:hypothetical protein
MTDKKKRGRPRKEAAQKPVVTPTDTERTAEAAIDAGADFQTSTRLIQRFKRTLRSTRHQQRRSAGGTMQVNTERYPRANGADF